MKRALPAEQDDGHVPPRPGGHSNAASEDKAQYPPLKVRRKGKGLMTTLRTLTGSGSGASEHFLRHGCSN